MFRAYVSI